MMLEEYTLDWWQSKVRTVFHIYGNEVKSSQVAFNKNKTSDNRTSFTSKINENKIVTKSIYNKIMPQYKM